MSYSDNHFRFVALLNRRADFGQLLNALGHMTAGLVSQCNLESLLFLEYKDADGTRHPAISTFPFNVLMTEKPGQLRTFRAQLIEAGLPYTDFTTSMLGSSAQEQLQTTLARRESELEYLGVCTFGPAEVLGPLTKKFSVFRLPSAVAAPESVTAAKRLVDVIDL